MKSAAKALALWLALAIGALPAVAAPGPTTVRPGFNLFSTQQDIELGRQSAAQVEKQIPLIHDPAIDQYVAAIGNRLAAAAPGPKFPYQFKVTNLSDVNAFALPGGFMYVNRGLIELVPTEGQLAGVMAHEMAHVALRHQTNQVSKAYLAKAGVGILGGGPDGRGAGADHGRRGWNRFERPVSEIQPHGGKPGGHRGRSDDGARGIRRERDG